MREITYESIVSAVRDLCIEANCALPCDLKEAIAKAEQTEPSYLRFVISSNIQG